MARAYYLGQTHLRWPCVACSIHWPKIYMALSELSDKIQRRRVMVELCVSIRTYNVHCRCTASGWARINDLIIGPNFREPATGWFVCALFRKPERRWFTVHEDNVCNRRFRNYCWRNVHYWAEMCTLLCPQRTIIIRNRLQFPLQMHSFINANFGCLARGWMKGNANANALKYGLLEFICNLEYAHLNINAE